MAPDSPIDDLANLQQALLRCEQDLEALKCEIDLVLRDLAAQRAEIELHLGIDVARPSAI